jgi:hypothetical protein
MSALRTASAAVAMLAFVTAGAALAQTPATPAPSAAPAAPSTPSTTTEDVSKWSIKQWNAAKTKWAKEKDKWADCEKQSKEQKLSGRKSWSFLASCMTS